MEASLTVNSIYRLKAYGFTTLVLPKKCKSLSRTLKGLKIQYQGFNSCHRSKWISISQQWLIVASLPGQVENCLVGHLRLEDAARDDAVEGLLLGRVQQVVLHGAGGRSGTVDELKWSSVARWQNLIPSRSGGRGCNPKERNGSIFLQNSVAEP